MIDRSPTASGVHTLFQLQLVRAAAALMVVLFHARGESRTRGLADPFPDLTFGAFGVDLFFVVSGFITVFASRRLFGRLGGMLPFFARRLVRIAPLYWVFTALYAVIAVVFGRLPMHPQASATNIVASSPVPAELSAERRAYLPICSLGWTPNC